MTNLPILIREITPFEHSVMTLLCEGKTNAAIARETNHSEKVIENTVSRTAHAFALHKDADVNLRVVLALAYRSHFGYSLAPNGENAKKAASKASNQAPVVAEVGPDGRKICHRHV